MQYTLDIGNSVGVWIACLPLMAVVVAQAVLIYKQAKKMSTQIGLSPEKTKTAFRTGMMTAFGPSFGGMISIISMSAIMGAPISWSRTSIIAAASTELRACQYTAEAAGVTLGGDGFTIQIFCACLFVMALNGCGWLVFCLLFTDKMTLVTSKISKGSTTMMTIIATAAILGTIMYMSSGYVKTAVSGDGAANMVAWLSAAVGGLILGKIAKKAPKLKQWSFGLSMLLGMIGGLACQYLLA